MKSKTTTEEITRGDERNWGREEGTTHETLLGRARSKLKTDLKNKRSLCMIASSEKEELSFLQSICMYQKGLGGGRED